MGTSFWFLEAEMDEIENEVVAVIKSAVDVEQWMVDMLADRLDRKFPTIFDRIKFIEKVGK